MQSPDLRFAGTGRDPACRISIDRRFPDFYGIQFMDKGSLVFQRDDGPQREFQRACFFWTDRMSRYRYGPGAGGSWSHRWIAIAGRTMDTYYRPLLEDLAPSGAVEVSNPTDCLRAFEGFLAAWKSGGASARLHALNRLLALLDDQRRGSRSSRDGIARIQAAIDGDPAGPRDFPALAREEGYSYSNFRRLFRKRCDCSPQRYLLDRRLHMAARLLTSTEDPVQEIGRRTGYDDPARFSQAFKKKFGAAPLTFRSTARLIGSGG